jgi:uncharacterized membrane protein
MNDINYADQNIVYLIIFGFAYMYLNHCFEEKKMYFHEKNTSALLRWCVITKTPDNTYL